MKRTTDTAQLDKERELRLALRMVETGLEFATGGALALLGVSVASLAILVAVAPQLEPGLRSQILIGLLAVEGCGTAILSAALILARRRRVEAVILAEDRLAAHRLGATAISRDRSVMKVILVVMVLLCGNRRS